MSSQPTGSINNRISKIEDKLGDLGCLTCYGWQAYIVLYDQEKQEHIPHPPSCPECGRHICAKVVRRDYWEALGDGRQTVPARGGRYVAYT